MKDFKHFGLKQRVFKECNYNALWNNLVTVRLGEGVASELPCDQSEFYDVGINTKCNAECPFCYVSASGGGINYPDICNTWALWMSEFFWQENLKSGVVRTNKPFQIAIGSTGEPTIHPDFCKFLETVYKTGVVPNYTTNGIILSSLNYKAEQILEATSNYVGGVAVSFGNKAIREQAIKAVDNLLRFGNTNVNIHHLISDKQSVDEFVAECVSYGDDIKYHVLLPLMPSGRSSEGVTEGTFEYLEDMIEKHNLKNVAFGAHFIKSLRNSKIKTWLYDEQTFSKNIILTPRKIQITPSSFNLNPMKVIEL